MIKLHICYRLKSIFPMTYLDNTFPNSSAAQAYVSFFKNQISYHLDLLYVTYSSIFLNSIQWKRMKNSCIPKIITVSLFYIRWKRVIDPEAAWTPPPWVGCPVEPAFVRGRLGAHSSGLWRQFGLARMPFRAASSSLLPPLKVFRKLSSSFPYSPASTQSPGPRS